jgi:uncharacterized membrane protein
MAGIGFELQRLGERGDLTGRITSFGYGAVVAAGPWLLTIVSLAIIGVVSSTFISANILASFRIIVVYAFANSLIVTAPTAIICARLLSDALYKKVPQASTTILICGLMVASISNGIIIAPIYFGVFALPLDLALPSVVSTILISMLWIAIIYCGATYDHIGIGVAFLLGVIFGLVGALVPAAQIGTAASMVWGYNLGLTATLFILLGRILRTFPFRVPKLAGAMIRFLSGANQYWIIAAGALIGALGLWIDKLIVWSSRFGQVTVEGLPHSPDYDGAMFIAYISIVPSLAAFVIYLETGFFENYVRYISNVLGHGTLARIEQSGERLGKETIRTINNIILLQVSLCAFLVVFAPVIIDLLGMRYSQIGILKFGIAATVFHFIFLACSAIILFLDLRTTYFTLQILFFTLNATMTIFSLMLGPAYLGYGYLVACCISGAIAYIVMTSSLRRIDYHTFVASIPKNRRGQNQAF